MVTSVKDYWIDRWFPAAESDGYILTSPDDPNYNCIAWAAGEDDIKWWPTPYETMGVFWPDGVSTEPTVESFVDAFGTLGWVDCGVDGSHETGFEKIALYVDKKSTVQHAARQLVDGTWTSKLGDYKDIQHTSPAALESSSIGQTDYGTVAIYMKRPLVIGSPEV